MCTIMRAPALLLLAAVALSAQPPKGWTKGKGYGWIWGPTDEIGALNAVSTPEHILGALRTVTAGKVYDLGVPYDRTSYKWPGHSPTEVVSYRSPGGVKGEKDIPTFAQSRKGVAFHSAALFISDNVGTQIDGLGHITTGNDNHWYNNFREATSAGDFGLRKADADSIPPIIVKGVLIDIAGWKDVDALPGNFAIGSKEMQAALAAQKVDVLAGDAVFLRTGTLRYWGASGSDHAKIAQHDSAGLTLEGARWLVETKGAVFVGGDTSGVEVGVDPALPGAAIPVHEYLLVEQGVHLGEFHNLEALARDKAYRFVYVATTNRVRGAAAGFTLRPIAIR
jgi:kynurenine formamidase